MKTAMPLKMSTIKLTQAELAVLAAFVIFGGQESAISKEGLKEFASVKKKLVAALRSA